MFSFFKKEEGISYNRKLIPILHEEHKEICEISNQIKKDIKNGLVGGVVEKLKKLQFKLSEHLLKEDAKLYEYLKKKNLIKKEKIEQNKELLDEVLEDIFKMMTKWKKIEINLDHKEELLKEFSIIEQEIKTTLEKQEKEDFILYK
jgi:hypothetical protein